MKGKLKRKWHRWNAPLYLESLSVTDHRVYSKNLFYLSWHPSKYNYIFFITVHMEGWWGDTNYWRNDLRNRRNWKYQTDHRHINFKIDCEKNISQQKHHLRSDAGKHFLAFFKPIYPVMFCFPISGCRSKWILINLILSLDTKGGFICTSLSWLSVTSSSS